MKYVLLIVLIVLITEHFLMPRFDNLIDSINGEAWLILWYGKDKERTYIKITKIS